MGPIPSHATVWTMAARLSAWQEISAKIFRTKARRGAYHAQKRAPSDILETLPRVFLARPANLVVLRGGNKATRACFAEAEHSTHIRAHLVHRLARVVNPGRGVHLEHQNAFTFARQGSI